MKTLAKNRVFTTAIIGLSLSLILGYIEAILPINIGLIGVKIGLSNIVTLICLKVLDIKWTLIINVLRLIILGILFSNLVRFLISVSGFVLSFILMCMVMKCLNFSMIVTSIIGGVSHNIGQVIAVTFITKNMGVYNLLYIYIGLGAVSGLIIGIISNLCYKSIKKVIIE
jgi:heptaprenyl diphosphate synthase